jgi:tRNA 2-selenouridine synthase
MQQVREISYEESRRLSPSVYVDVRSPSEYEEDHVPGAVNIPLFDDRERKEVGTWYREKGRQEAILLGCDIVGRKLSQLYRELSRYDNIHMILYCARGGMRSGSLASLMAGLNRPVCQLSRGYKSYRAYVNRTLEDLEINHPLYVLQGLTGTGKTEILRRMEYSLDLEGMAGHRSSIFGAMGLIQKSQKRFESSLLARLEELKEAPWIVVEGESKKLGNLHIPPSLFQAMREGHSIRVEAPMERRKQIIIDDYTRNIDPRETEGILVTLRSRLGRTTVDKMIVQLHREEYGPLVETLLSRYYDPLYRHTLDNLSPVGSIENLDSDTSAREITRLIESHQAILKKSSNL